MKTSNLLSIAALALTTIFASCTDSSNNIDMLTVIEKDGSCHRELVFEKNKKDSKPKHQDKIYEDENWQKEWETIADTVSGDTTLICTAKQDFASVEAMAAAYPIQINGEDILKNSSLEKSFQWFFTDYTYTETFKDFSHYFNVPITKYLSEEEASFWLTGTPNLYKGYSGYEIEDGINDMAKAFVKWENANVIYEVVEHFAKNADSFQEITVSSETLLQKRDSLIDYAINKGFSIYEENFVQLGTLMDAFFQSDCFEERWSNGEVNIPTVDTLISNFENIDALHVNYRLAMPKANVVDCGDGYIEDGTVAYRFSGMRLLTNDYTMQATFRAPNIWAYVVTLLAVILAFWGIVRGIKKSAKGSRH